MRMRALLLALLLLLPAGAESLRQEVLLEKAPASQLMRVLAGRYPRLFFTAHPTMNGFYVMGPREDILALKAEVPGRDQWPSPPRATVREFGPVEYGPEIIVSVVKTLVPDVTFEVDERRVIMEGPPASVEMATELLAEFDRPPSMVLDCSRSDIPFLAARRAIAENGAPMVEKIGDNLKLCGFDPVAGGFQETILELGHVTKGGRAQLGWPPTGPPGTVLTPNLQFLVTQSEAKV